MLSNCSMLSSTAIDSGMREGHVAGKPDQYCMHRTEFLYSKCLNTEYIPAETPQATTLHHACICPRAHRAAPPWDPVQSKCRSTKHTHACADSIGTLYSRTERHQGIMEASPFQLKLVYNEEHGLPNLMQPMSQYQWCPSVR